MKEIFNKIKNSISGSKKRIEDAPENTRHELVEPLKWVDGFDLYSIDMSDLWELDVTSTEWDTVKFKKWVVKKDEIWNYIMINGMKCREHQPWISWFVYKDIRDRYHSRDWLRIWFCDKWKFKKSVVIDESFGPKIVDIIPGDVSDELWWPFYEVNDMNSIKRWPLNDIIWDDVYKTEELNLDKVKNRIKGEIIHKNNWESSIKIKWKEFREYKHWASGFVYKQFSDPYRAGKYLLLAEYKDWKMIWEWIIMNPTREIHVITANNKKEK